MLKLYQKQMLYEKQIRPPWVPDVRGIGDASYFHVSNQQLVLNNRGYHSKNHKKWLGDIFLIPPI